MEQFLSTWPQSLSHCDYFRIMQGLIADRNRMLPPNAVSLRWHILTICLVGLLFVYPSACLAAQTEIIPTQKWRNYFSGREQVFSYGIVSNDAFKGRAAWRVSAEKLTIIRGESAIHVHPNGDNQVAFKVPLPSIKAGLIRSVDIDVVLFKERSHAAIARHTRRIWLFHEDPFQLNQQALTKHNIYLFDPILKTAPVFRAVHIPFESVVRLSDVRQLREAMLIIGEGLSLQEFRGLSELLKETAEAGNKVICLAMDNGQLPIAQNTGPDFMASSSMVFRGSEVISMFDGHLDAEYWPPDGPMIDSRLHLEGQRGRVSGRIQSDGQGWPWVEFDYKKTNGKLVLCGFAIVRKWETGPAPRYLLDRMLQHIGKDLSPYGKQPTP